MNKLNPIFTFVCLGFGVALGSFAIRRLGEKIFPGKTHIPQKGSVNKQESESRYF